MEFLARFLDKVKDLDINKSYFEEMDGYLFQFVNKLKQTRWGSIAGKLN